MYCTKCGSEVQNGAAFCSSCGAKIETQNASQEQQGNSQAYTPIPSVTLRSMPPASVNPAGIAMFKVKNTGIAMEMDGEWGEKVFSYLNTQEMYDDCGKLFTALQQITQNRVMQFRSEGMPVVPLYRIKKVNASDWWGPTRLELDIEGAGGQWLTYSDKSVRDADEAMLVNLMYGGRPY